MALVADVDPRSGIDFVHITSAGNAAWLGDGTPGDRAIGRGRVDHEYYIGRMEVTTEQWVGFFNAAFDRPADDRLPWLVAPEFWGAAGTTPNTPGGRRWRVPAGNEQIPVGGISWRMAAMYTNWLHNDQRTDRDAFLNGAYDVSLFGPAGDRPGFSDQPTRNPGARYWIPSWDEWLKAAHYDPNRHGPGQGGWWTYSNSSDTAPVPGPPGVGEANFGWRAFEFPGQNPFAVPLGAYPETQSPWGLLDLAGATGEWTEEILLSDGFPQSRLYDGSWWASSGGFGAADRVGISSGQSPEVPVVNFGFRVAAAVPAPSSVTSVTIVGAMLFGRRLRRPA